MKYKWLRGLSALVTLAVLSLGAGAAEIAYVDARRLIDEAPQGKDEIKRLQEDFLERNRELQARIELFASQEAELQKNAVLLSSEELEEKTIELREEQRKLQREQQIYNEDYAQSRDQGLVRLEKLISEVIIDIARRENIDIVFQQAVYASDRIDLTGKVLEELGRRHGQ